MPTKVTRKVGSTVFHSRDYECDLLDDPFIKRIMDTFPGAKVVTGRVMPRRWVEVPMDGVREYVPTPLYTALQIPDRAKREKAVRQLCK